MLIELLHTVIDPHSQLADRLLGLVRRSSTAAPPQNPDFEAAAVIVFLAGVDKLLALSCELLYLAGHVEWGWMEEGRRKSNVLPGRVFCGRGFFTKISKLRELGCDLTKLQWLSESRNKYVHECSIFAGYGIYPDFDAKRLDLRATGPVIESFGPFQLGFRAEDINTMSTDLVAHLGAFLTDSHCEEALRQIADRIAQLHENPEPWTTRLREIDLDHLDMFLATRIIEELNAKVVGNGLAELLQRQKSPPNS